MNKILLATVLLFLASCTKQPGEGGGASIRGKVMTEVRVVPANPNSVVNTYPAADEDVFIVYGDNVSPDDRVWTNYNGEFEFQFLRQGNYTIYLLSADTNSTSTIDPNAMPIIREIEITGRKESIDLGEITIYEEF